MTKEQMMGDFDELLTDRRLTRVRAEEHLAASADKPGLLYNQYVCLASGAARGCAACSSRPSRSTPSSPHPSSGVPWPGCPRRRAAGRGPACRDRRRRLAGTLKRLAAAVARGYPVRMITVPATLPADEIVRRLNDAQLPALLAHTSTLVLLAGEQRAGRLRISPQTVTAMSELLTEQDRTAIREAFGVPPIDQFVSTEGLVGHNEPGGAVLSFATDTCIIGTRSVHPPGRILRHAFRPAGDGGRRFSASPDGSFAASLGGRMSRHQDAAETALAAFALAHLGCSTVPDSGAAPPAADMSTSRRAGSRA